VRKQGSEKLSSGVEKIIRRRAKAHRKSLIAAKLGLGDYFNTRRQLAAQSFRALKNPFVGGLHASYFSRLLGHPQVRSARSKTQRQREMVISSSLTSPQCCIEG
jgi:hypothetical protein